MSRALVVLLALGSSPLAAQQHPLVGTWQISYPAGVRVENGSPTVLMASGALTIETQGDSLIATLVNDPAPDLPARPPARLAAIRAEGPVEFVSRTQATLNFNGEAREATAVSTWRLSCTGDSLQGTVERRLEGFEAGNQPPRPVTGTRRKG